MPAASAECHPVESALSSRAQARFRVIVDFVRKEEVSDVSLLQTQITARMDGRVTRLAEEGALGRDEVQEMIRELLAQAPDRGQTLLAGDLAAVDFTARLHGKRFRVNVARSRRELFASLRPLPDAPPENPAQVGLSAHLLERFLSLSHGLVLVTGPAGAGKTTTIAALIEALNRSREAKIITVEDPVEFEFPCRRAEVIQREVGVDVESYAAGLKDALRQAPDVIMLGEIRDSESATTALQAAETGHLVISSLHAQSAAETISRYLLLGPAERAAEMRYVLAHSLRVIINQRLLRKRGGGRLAVRELLVHAPKVAAVIMRGNEQELRDQMLSGRDLGMVDFQTALRQSQGQLDPQEVARYRDA
ncbi:MAG: Flp pilus assembly complex ATPase component TadA [Verrucomicrobia bacterium]|nr:Flp pilus assembly complex ATPase component TadA [Verrucomicrobiota bacterium]